MTEWHPKMTRELIPGRSVHDWDGVLGTLTTVEEADAPGMPGP